MHVTSQLDQNNSLLIGLPKKTLGRLQLVQNTSARLIIDLKKREHVATTLVQLHWLPMNKDCFFKLLLTYKALDNKGPSYLKELLILYKPARSLRSSSENLLCVPVTHYRETQKRAFSARAPAEWNNLPTSIRNKTRLNSFNIALKMHLFKIACMVRIYV